MKAILVLDQMPNGCVECPLARTVYGEMMCVVTERETNYIIGVDKPGSCPLREMPEKQDVCGTYPREDEKTPSYFAGFNDCLKAIEGSGEE